MKRPVYCFLFTVNGVYELSACASLYSICYSVNSTIRFL